MMTRAVFRLAQGVFRRTTGRAGGRTRNCGLWGRRICGPRTRLEVLFGQPLRSFVNRLSAGCSQKPPRCILCGGFGGGWWERQAERRNRGVPACSSSPIPGGVHAPGLAPAV